MSRYALFAVGILLGMVFTILSIAGYHASSNPVACTTCHSMNQVGVTWRMSNHKQFACVECHMPDSGTVTRLIYKARAGLHDLWHETIRDYPAAITASSEARSIVQSNCVRCHYSTVERVSFFMSRPPASPQCTRCHRHIVHKTRKEIEE